ncbi:MAG: TIR domain-containing protein [Methanoregula sp.]|jgi:DNA-directed RNA polymerase subunit L|uniref:TIR domain-containing protein n=1 Tax=Methanoregula sp. TaxID=2052170 RepID=UPI003D0F366F
MGGGIRGARESFAIRRYESDALLKHKPQKSIDDYGQTKPRVFISFHIDDENQVNLLRHQAKNSDQLEFIDYSVKEPFDDKWKTRCNDRINQSTVVVVAIGEKTHEREAVNWEIRKAHELGKPVIGMRIHSDKNHKIPPAMEEYGDRVVPWNLDSIQSEIDRARNDG